MGRAIPMAMSAAFALAAMGQVTERLNARAQDAVVATSSAPSTAATSRAAAGDWTKLFADEAWYKAQEGKEQVFNGTLKAVANADRPSTLMRTSYYSLGDRTIYTGAKKVPALDALVGKKVEIRGKPYDIELEGQAVHEIWPAAVRAVE